MKKALVTQSPSYFHSQMYESEGFTLLNLVVCRRFFSVLELRKDVVYYAVL